MKSGNLSFLEPSGPLQACNGTALPLPSCPLDYDHSFRILFRTLFASHPRTQMTCGLPENNPHTNFTHFTRFQDLTVDLLKCKVLWDMEAWCWANGSRNFEGSWCFHPQGHLLHYTASDNAIFQGNIHTPRPSHTSPISVTNLSSHLLTTSKHTACHLSSFHLFFLASLILKNEGTMYLWKVRNHPTAYHHNPEDLNT